MNLIAKFCSYYCAVASLLALIFFAILAGFFMMNSEYFNLEFLKDGDKKGRITSISIVLIINAILFILCFACIKRNPDEEPIEDDSNWKFAYKLERARDVNV
jgi:uncharacterized BrkB/YihY/UPF0761 family membrane protein